MSIVKKLRRGIKKVGKKIGAHFKKVGKKLKSGLKKVAGKFAELGPLGSIALSFVIPTVGAWIQGMDGTIIAKVADGIGKAAGAVKNGVGKVFNTVMDGVENGMNGIAGKAMTERGWGSSFRDGVSKLTGDFIEGSTKGLDLPAKEGLFKTGDAFDAAKASGEVDFKQAQARYDRKLDSRISKLNKRAAKGRLGEAEYNTAMKDLLDSRPTDQSAFKIEPRKPFSERDTFRKDQAIGERSIFGKASPATPKDALSFKEMKAQENLKLRDYLKTSKEFGIAKRIMPVQAATTQYFRQEEAQQAALEYAKTAQRKYFSNVAQQTLIRPVSPNVSYMDFSTDLSDMDMYRLQNSYTGILGEGLYA
jgi:predicted HicB family RNase H-like nuclease